MTDARPPKSISGLVGWYTGLSAEVNPSGSLTSWKDISGQGNHVTTMTGSPKAGIVTIPITDMPNGNYYDDFSSDTSGQYLNNVFVSRGTGARWIWDTNNGQLLSDTSNDDLGLRVNPSVFNYQNFATLDITVNYGGTTDNDGVGVIIYDGTIDRTWIAKISNEYSGAVPEIMYTDSLSSGVYVKVASAATNINTTQSHILRMTYDFETRNIIFYVDAVEILSYTHTDIINIETFGIASLGLNPESKWNSISASYKLINNTRFPFLYGATTDGLRFPTTVMNSSSPNYTLFHVARYYNPTGTPTRGRIFDGFGNNWLSGFYLGPETGGAYHGIWITPEVNLHGDQWILSTDQRNMYRSNGTDRTDATSTSNKSTQLTINYGSSTTQTSHWAVAEVIVYNRELDINEYTGVEAYLSAKYFGSKTIPTSGVISGSILNAILNIKNDGGFPISIAKFGQRIGTTYGTLLRASDFRGLALPDGSTKELAVPSADYLVTNNIRTINGLYWIKPEGFIGEAFQVYCDLTGLESGIGSGGWMRVEYAADLYTQADPWALAPGFSYSGDFSFTYTNEQIAAMKATASQIRQTLDSYGKGSVGWTYAGGSYQGCKTIDGSIYNSTTSSNLPFNTDYSFNGWNSSGVITPRGTDPTDANDQTWRQGRIYLVESGNTHLPILGIYNRDVDAANEERYFPLVSGGETFIWIR